MISWLASVDEENLVTGSSHPSSVERKIQVSLHTYQFFTVAKPEGSVLESVYECLWDKNNKLVLRL